MCRWGFVLDADHITICLHFPCTHIPTQSPNLFTGSIAYNIAYCKGQHVQMDDPELRVRV